MFFAWLYLLSPFHLISKLASIKQCPNTLPSSKNAKSTGKILVMTVAPGKIKVQNKHDLLQQATQEKVATLTHSMNDVMVFYVFNTRFKSIASIAQKGNIFCTKESRIFRKF